MNLEIHLSTFGYICFICTSMSRISLQKKFKLSSVFTRWNGHSAIFFVITDSRSSVCCCYQDPLRNTVTISFSATCTSMCSRQLIMYRPLYVIVSFGHYAECFEYLNLGGASSWYRYCKTVSRCQEGRLRRVLQLMVLVLNGFYCLDWCNMYSYK